MDYDMMRENHLRHIGAKLTMREIKSLKYPVILKQALPYGGDGTIKLLQKQQMNIIKNTAINPTMKGIEAENR